MTAKEYLSQAFLLDRRIRARERQLEGMRAHLAYAVPSVSEGPKAPSSVRSMVEETAVRIIALEERIACEIAELVGLREEIARAIAAVGNQELETVLEMRYLAFMRWEEISSILGYGSKYVFEVHRRALDRVWVPT